mmetsp:Transcript_46165/g.108069  ORF Transcript_46165/g.108069 Transcript_46165/m.108069 type:complete len:360 (+) Transcript_46165:1817-2896(+)
MMPQRLTPVIHLQRVGVVQPAPGVLLRAEEDGRQALHAHHGEERVVIQRQHRRLRNAATLANPIEEAWQIVVVEEVQHQAALRFGRLLHNPVSKSRHRLLLRAGHEDVLQDEVERVVVHRPVVPGGVAGDVGHVCVDHLVIGRNRRSRLRDMVEEVPVDVPGCVNAYAVKPILVHVVSHPLHQALPHHGVLVVEVRQAIQLAMLEEVRTALIVSIMDEAAVVTMVVLRLVERFQDGHFSGIRGIHLLRPCMIHVHINDDLHLSFVQENHHLSHIFLRAVGWVHLCQVLCPVAVVAMRHLVHNRGQNDSIHTKLLQIAHLLHEAWDAAAAVLVQLFAVLGLRSGKAVDEDLVHCYLRPRP